MTFSGCNAKIDRNTPWHLRATQTTFLTAQRFVQACSTYYETWRQYATLQIYYHWFVTSFESSISQENYLIRLLVINSSRNFAKISVETQDPKYTVRDYIFRFKWLFLPTKAHPYLYTGIKLKVTLPLRAPVWNISCRQRIKLQNEQQMSSACYNACNCTRHCWSFDSCAW